MLHSIQGRIVLGSVVIAAIVLALFSVVLGQQMRQVAGSSVAALASNELQAYVSDLHTQPNEHPDPPAPGQQVLVLSPTGATAIDTLPTGLADAVRRSGVGMRRLHANGVSYVSVGEVVTDAAGTWRLWALRSSASADLALQNFQRVLLLAIPVVLVLVALGSWLLVAAAFRPVRRLRTAADQIRASGNPGRLPEGRGRDELAALTATLNRFLEAQHEGVERERRMVADASHELRTPLAVLTTQLELADRHFGDAAALERAVRAARSQVRAISRLTTQLLELSQLESDDSDRSRRGATVGALVSEAMAGVDRARVIAPPDTQVELDIAGELDEDVHAPLNTTAFGRIVDNLARNALNATRSGSVEVRISQTPTHLVLMVADSGTGVPPEFLPRAFDRFTRSEASRAAGTEGSGLGLALVRALVHAAGGDVTLANRPGGGATATVTIPLGS